MQAYAIALLNNKHAQQLLKDCVASGLEYNWSVQAWPAVVGTGLSPSSFSQLGLFLNPETKIYRRPGAQGCYMSHRQLWHECVKLNKPIVILESDAIINGPLPDFDPALGILKLHQDRGTKTGTSGTWSKGAHAYMLAPEHAQALLNIKEVRPVDKAIGTNFVAWQHSDQNIVTLNPLRGPSTTARS